MHNRTISIIGLGYVGLPLVLRFAEVGFNSFGLDIDKEKVNKLKVTLVTNKWYQNYYWCPSYVS